MIMLPDTSPCAACNLFKGVKQPHGYEIGEYFCCSKFDRIPVEYICGKTCEKQEKEEE